MTLTHALLAALAALGLSLLIACAKPQPYGEDLWRVVKHTEHQRLSHAHR